MKSIWYLRNYPYLTLISSGRDSDLWRMLSPGEIWSGAEETDQAFIIARGRLFIRRLDPDGGMSRVEILNPGDIVGTVTTAGQTESVHEVIALDSCVGYVLDCETLKRRVATKQLPEITFMRLEGWRFRRYVSHPRDLVFRPFAARLASALLTLAQQYPGAVREGGQSLACTPQTRHLADLTGSSVEQTREALEEWKSRGWLDWAHGRIILKNITRFWDLVRPTSIAECRAAA